MTIEIEKPGSFKTMEFVGFIDMMNSGVFYFEKYDDLVNAGSYLQMLGKNRSFLVNMLNEEVKNFSKLQAANIYGPNVFMLASCKKFFMRANLWFPISIHEAGIKGFKYDVVHDHNFDILTVGYLGPDYVTGLYEYDESMTAGFIDEKGSFF